MKHNVGDKVYMREDLKAGKVYDNMTYTSYMDKFKGKELTIKEIRIDKFAYRFHNEINRYYVIEGDEEGWGFVDAMLKE